MRKGLLATGVAMIVLAIIVFAPSSWINQVQSNNVQTCNSFTGQLSQSLSQENTTVCNNAPGFLAVAQTGMIIAIVLGVLGIALIVIGAIKNPAPRPQQQPSQPQEKIDQYIATQSYPRVTVCKFCNKEVKWWEDSIDDDNSLLHNSCYKRAKMVR